MRTLLYALAKLADNNGVTVEQIYKLAIDLGRKNDFRPAKDIDKMLARLKEKYEKMSAEDKKLFDIERLSNPYSDTRILYNSGKKVKRVLTGIDTEASEMLLADRLGNIDLVIGHHPEGRGLARLDEVMHLQADVLAQYGVPINVAESLLHVRISEVARGLSPSNHERAVQVAELLKISFMCTHTIADNMAASFLKKKIDDAKPEYVGDLMKLIKEIPEYQAAIKLGSEPALFSGSEDRRCGKIALTEITGGTEGSAEIYERLAHAGVGTVVAMHMSEKHTEAAKKAHINAIVAGHMSSDSIGMNLFLDELEKRGVEIVPCSGLFRVSRVKKPNKK